MTYQDFREKIKNLQKYPGTVAIDRCPLVTPGFPGAFNMSFGEDPILKEFGKYQFFDHDAAFSTIQQVIRHNDVFGGVKIQPEKYLGLFEMADIFGLIMLKENVDFKDLQEKQVRATIKLLTDLGIQKSDIYPRYCSGGSVKKLTNGKYSFDFEIPEDVLTLNSLIETGIPKANIIRDYSRDTLLALNLASGNIAWGYRTEIEVKSNDRLVDVAAIELFLWDPLFNEGGQITGLKDISYTLALTVTGVERLYMVAHGLPDVREIDHIEKLYNFVKDEGDVDVEYLRTLHAIMADKEEFGFELGKHRRVYMNRMVRDINVPKEKIRNLLAMNVELQPWHPELQNGVESTMAYINLQRTR